jgi:hypothetical protein
VSRACSLDYHEERLPLFDDVRRELGRIAAADVPHRVDRFGRDEQGVAGDDLLARMLVLDGWRFRADVHAVLDDFASGNAEIVRAAHVRRLTQRPERRANLL